MKGLGFIGLEGLGSRDAPPIVLYKMTNPAPL